MKFADFETDVKTAEAKINENDNEGLQLPTDESTNGDQGLCSAGSDSVSESGKKYASHELGLFAGITNDEYHSGPGISSSSLKYANKSMSLFHAHMTGKASFQESVAMRLGTAVHKLCLEAMDFSSDIAVSKKFGTSKKAKEEKEAFYAANPGKTIITAEDYDKCRFMRDSLMALPEAEFIFDGGGEPELSGYYIDKSQRGDGTGMLCKYRPDLRLDWCLFDVKSTVDASAEAFSRTIHKFGYHISAAHYLEGDRITKGTDHRKFVFGCVESEPPYLAAMYKLEDESLELGEYKRRQALNGIKHGRKTGEWPEMNSGLTTEIGVPQYAMYELTRSKI